MSSVAIIPARGGSKRIPRKNIRDFLGKPIIAYSIETAINSKLFDEVMVSTDDEEIASIARHYGAKVPFLRSSKNSDDYSTTLEVIQEVDHSYKSHLNKEFDFICCIYPTAPMIRMEKLIEGKELLIKNSLDVVFPIVPFSYPIWRGVQVQDGLTKMVWPEYTNTRSQDLTAVYHDAGQWYWCNPRKLDKVLFTSNTASVIVAEEEVQDIDTYSDWSIAEMKYSLLNAK